MSPRVKNILSFFGAIVLGLVLQYVNATSGSFALFNPLVGVAATFGGGFCVLLFGKPYINHVQGIIGWGLLGTSVGMVIPFVLLLVLYVG